MRARNNIHSHNCNYLCTCLLLHFSIKMFFGLSHLLDRLPALAPTSFCLHEAVDMLMRISSCIEEDCKGTNMVPAYT